MESHPRPPKAKFSSVKELYDIYKNEYLGKTIQTISGHRMTFKPGHFFRLIAATPEGERKGYISKAESAADAVRMIENGEINVEDIAGFQRPRAENIVLFKDVLTDSDFYFSEGKNHIVFGKKYAPLKHADGFIAVTLEIDDKGNLGPVSFHPRKFTDNLLRNRQIKWNIGDIGSASPNDAVGKSAEKTSDFAEDTVYPTPANVKSDLEKKSGTFRNNAGIRVREHVAAASGGGIPEDRISAWDGQS